MIICTIQNLVQCFHILCKNGILPYRTRFGQCNIEFSSKLMLQCQGDYISLLSAKLCIHFSAISSDRAILSYREPLVEEVLIEILFDCLLPCQP